MRSDVKTTSSPDRITEPNDQRCSTPSREPLNSTGAEPMALLTEVLHRIADHKVNKLYELFPQNLKLPELKPYKNHPRV